MDLNSFILKSREILFLSNVFPVEINKNEAFRFYTAHLESCESVEKAAQIYCAELKRRNEKNRKKASAAQSVPPEVMKSFESFEMFAYNETLLDVDGDAILFCRVNKAPNELVSTFISRSLKGVEDYFIDVISEKIEYLLGNDGLRKLSLVIDLEQSTLLGDVANSVFEKFLLKVISVLSRQNPER